MKDHCSNWIIWIGEPIVRIGNKTFYSKFRYGKLKGKIGGFFTVCNPDHNEKPGQVVQIVQLFEAHDAKEDKYRAIVKWFVDCTSLSKTVTNYRSVKHKLNFGAEIILDDARDPNADISIRKLQGRCHVIFGRTTNWPPDMPQKHHPVYLCRYKVTEQRGRPQLEPYFSDDEEDVVVSDAKLQMQPVIKLERINAFLPGSPRIPRSDPSTRLCGKKSLNGKFILVKKAAVPNGDTVTITDSESETEDKNIKVPVRRLPNAKLTEEEIVSLLTADDDIDSDDNIFSEFEDEAPDDISDEKQFSTKPSGVNHVQRKLILHSNALRNGSSNSNTLSRQRRTRDTSSSDDDYDDRCHVKRRKLELVTTPTSSPKQLKQPQLPHKDESSLPVSEAQMTRTSPAKSRTSGLKGNVLCKSKASSRTPKKNLGLQPKHSDIPAIQVISEARMISSPTKYKSAGLKDNVLSEPKVSSRTPNKNLGLQPKPSESPAIQTVSETRLTRTTPNKSRPGQLKDNVLSDPKASSSAAKKKLISGLQSVPSDSPVIQMSEGCHEMPREAGIVKLLHSSPPRPFEKTSLIAHDSSDNAPKRSSPRTPVSNKRYDDSWLVDIKLKPQPEKVMVEAKNDKQRLLRATTRVYSDTDSPQTPRNKKQKGMEEEESHKETQTKTPLKMYLNSVTSSPKTPRSRKICFIMLRAVPEEEEIEQVQYKLTSRIQQVSSNASSPRTPRSRRKVVEEGLEDRQIHSSLRVHQPTSSSNSPRTPRSKKGSSVRRTLLTPSMPTRGHSVESPSSLLEVVRSRLCVSAVPKSLPCRENEFNNIYHFLEGKIIDKASGCMYVSGVPGTGKTATVQEVVRSLKNKADHNEIPGFDLVELNGMRMTEPRQAYVQLYRALTGQTVVADQAQQLLEKRFSTSRKKQDTTVVIVDETKIIPYSNSSDGHQRTVSINVTLQTLTQSAQLKMPTTDRRKHVSEENQLDMLCTRRQDVVYNLLDWPTKASSQLVVVTIANTMDLPEKLLKGRVTSRLGLTRVTFQPYTFQQLKTIVMERLKGLNVFDHDAIELVSRKVAAVSGDARRALDICRRATELAEGRADVVGMQHVDEAVREMSISATVRMIKSCSTLEQNFLKAVLAKMQASGLDEASFRAVYDEMFAICTFDGIKVPSVTEALQICAALGSARLLIVKHSRHDIHQDILLNVSRDDLHYALQVAAT